MFQNNHDGRFVVLNNQDCREAVLSEVEQRFDCVQAQTHMYPSLVGGFHPHPEPNSSPPSPKSSATG